MYPNDCNQDEDWDGKYSEIPCRNDTGEDVEDANEFWAACKGCPKFESEKACWNEMQRRVEKYNSENVEM